MKRLMLATLVLAAGLAAAGESKPANQVPGLKGLFGVKFGSILDEGLKVSTNEQGFLSVAFHPEKEFLSFSDYMMFATPATKTIYHVRAIAPSVPSESTSLAKTAVRLIELRFDVKAVEKDGGQVLSFPNGDFIRVTQESGHVVLDAVRSNLMDVLDQECQAVSLAREEAESKSFANDILGLQLILKTQANGASNITLSVSSVLGKTFGQPLPESDRAKLLPDGTWSAAFSPVNKVAGCTAFEVFGSAKTKSVFRVRAICEGATDTTAFIRLRKIVELAFRSSLTRVKDNENYGFLRVGNLLVTLSKDAESGRISLDFTDPSVVVRHDEERKQLSDVKFWRDINAL